MQYKQACQYKDSCRCAYCDHPHKQTNILICMLMPPDARTGWSSEVNPQLAAVQQACRSPCNTHLHKRLAAMHQVHHMNLANLQNNRRHNKTAIPGPKALVAATNTQQTRSKHTTTPKGHLNSATVSVHNNNAAPTTQCLWGNQAQCENNLGVGRVGLLQSCHKSTPQCHLPTAFHRCW